MLALGVNPKFRTAKFGLKKQQTLFYCTEHNRKILNGLGVTHECDGLTAGRTDIIVANAAFNYDARTKSVR